MKKILITVPLALVLVLAQAFMVSAKTDTELVNIIVDLTPPEINISGVVEGGKYSSPITLMVSAKDDSGDVTVTTNLKRLGRPVAWTSRQEIGDYGTYTLVVSAVDLGGNKTEKSIDFTLTTAGPPTIKLDKEQYITGETMTIMVSDFNRIGQGTIDVTAYGVQGNPKVICKETEPGFFEGKYTFFKGVLSGGFYIRYDYDPNNKKYVEAAGLYVVSGNNEGVGGIPKPEKPNVPGKIVDVIDGNEAKAPADGDTAFFKSGSNGQYEYVPSIYDPSTGKYRILDQDGRYIMVTLPGSLNQRWASTAKDWFEQRKIAPKTSGEFITAKEAAQVAARATGSPAIMNPNVSGSTVVTPVQMEQIIQNMINTSPLGGIVDQAEINRWAQDRRSLAKPLTKSEVMVTMHWFLQKANMAK